jgi:cation transport ATPase
MSSPVQQSQPVAAGEVELSIGGMTCASCATRIERKLNKVDGVSATVNYATEKAKVSYSGDISPEDLVKVVEATGYTAELPAPRHTTTAVEGEAAESADPTRSVRQRLITSAVLAIPVILLAMVPAFQFTYWQWLSLALAGPVVTWGAWPFHKAAWTNLRHGAATMDTLISLGVGAGFRNEEGLGVQGVVDGKAVIVGRAALLEQWSMYLDDTLDTAKRNAEAHGRTAVLVAWDGKARAVLVVADTVKPSSAEAVRALRGLGLRPVLLTGDNEAAARAVAAEVGIDEVIAEVMPKDKVDVITRLQKEGRVVAMVGDGVNDAPALAQADLGLAMGTGTDVAIEASDLTLVRGDLRATVDAIRLARKTLGTIKGNLFWAFAYNVAALPPAALGLLNPMIAGAAMAFSSVFVVSNSLRLRGFRSSINATGK